mgnify:CR=1 FL=1
MGREAGISYRHGYRFRECVVVAEEAAVLKAGVEHRDLAAAAVAAVVRGQRLRVEPRPHAMSRGPGHKMPPNTGGCQRCYVHYYG